MCLKLESAKIDIFLQILRYGSAFSRAKSLKIPFFYAKNNFHKTLTFSILY